MTEKTESVSRFNPLFTSKDRFKDNNSSVFKNILDQFTGNCKELIPSKNERSLTFNPIIFLVYIISLIVLFSSIRYFDDNSKNFSSYRHKPVLQVTESLWNMVLLAIIPFLFCNFSRTFGPLTIVGMFLGAIFMRIINHVFTGYTADSVWNGSGLNKVLWVLGGFITLLFYITMLSSKSTNPKQILFTRICMGLLILSIIGYVVIASVFKNKTEPLGVGLGLGILGIICISYTLWIQYRECKLPRTLMMILLMFLWIASIMIIRKTSKEEADKNAKIHIHHYQIGYLGMFITSGNTQLSALINGFMIGLFVDGISSWGADSTVEEKK